MVDTIFVLNRNKEVIEVLSNNGAFPDAPFFDDVYTPILDTGAETYEFSTFSNARTSNALIEGNYVLFHYDNKYKLFQIIETSDEHADEGKILTCHCEIAGLELLTDYCEPFSIEGNAITFFNTVLQDTNWNVGKYSASLETNIQSVKVKENQKVYTVIQENLAKFGGIEIEYRVEFKGNTIIGFFIDLYDNGQRGSKVYNRFEYGENVKGITRQKSLQDFASASIGEGKNGLNFKDVEWRLEWGDPADKPLGQNFVVDIEANNQFNKHGKYIKDVYKSDTEDARTLLEETWEHLQEVKKPKTDYEVDLGVTSAEYENMRIGDTNYVLDFDYNPPILLSARISKLEISFSDSTKNKCTLSNYKELKSFLHSEDIIDEIVSSYFPITGELIDKEAIGEEHIKTTYIQKLKTDIVEAGLVEVKVLIADKADIKDLGVLNASIENLKANKADIEQLNAINATIERLKVEDLAAINASIEKLKTEDLTAINSTIENLKANTITAIEADIKNLKADKASIKDLEAANATIGSLQATVGKIDTLINGNLTSDNIHSLILTSSKVTVENGFIKNAMIDSLSASKINTGTLNTNLVSIQSEDGSLILNGNLQQFKDKNGKVRIQMGKDATGNFTFAIFDETGTGTLIDSTGVKAKAIGNGIIVNDMISNDAGISGNKLDINSVVTSINNGTTNISGTKIQLDEKNQTLEVAFNSMSNTVTEQGKTIGSHTTSIEAVKGDIKTLISDTTIVEEGNNIKIKDAFSSLKQNVGEISTKISQVESDFDNVNANVQITVKSVKPQYYLSTSTTSCVGGTWQDTSPTWTQGKYMWQRLHYTYVNGTTSTGKETCIAGAVGDKGDKGDKGETGATGAAGQSVTSITPQYVAHTSSTTAPTSGWSDSCPAYSAGKFLWTRSKVIYANPSATKYTTPVYEPSWEAKNVADSASKTVTTKVAEFTQNLDGFKQTVSETYATQKTVSSVSDQANAAKTQADKGVADAKTASDKATNAQSTADSANSKVDGLRTEYNSTKSKVAEITTNLDGITQRVQSTENTTTTLRTDLDKTTTTANNANNKIDGLQIGGRNLYLRTKVINATDWGNKASWETSEIENGFTVFSRTGAWSGVYQNIELESGQMYTLSAWVKGDGKATLNGYVDRSSILNPNFKQNGVAPINWTRVYFSFIQSGDGVTKPRFENSIDGTTLKFYGFKLEKGNKATDWTSAPEDVQTQIDANKTQISTTNSRVAEITTNLDGITQRVTSTEKNVTTVTNTANAAKTQADKAVSDAKTASDKAASAQSTADSANSKIDGLEIGVRNYVKGTSDTFKELTMGSWNVLPSTIILSDVGLKVGDSIYVGAYIQNPSSSVDTVAVRLSYVRADNTYSQSFGNFISIGGEGMSTFIGSIPANTVKIYVGFQRKNGSDSAPKFIFKHKELILCKSNKIIGWSPAPEDIQSQIDANKTEISSTKSKVSSIETNLGSITSRVGAVETKQTTTGNKVTSLETWKAEAEQKITETAITNTVKKNFYTKDETNNQITSKGYQTASQVQQTVNGLQVKVSQSGGYNLIKNSTGAGYNTNNWTHNGSSLGVGYNDTIGSNCRTYIYLDNGTTTSERFAFSNRFKLKPNTKYTFVGYFHNYNTCPSFDVFLLSSTSLPDTDSSTNYTNAQQLIATASTGGAWKKYKVTITTPANTISGYIRIDNNGYNSGGGSDPNRIHWNALMLTEGELELPWSSHPSELYDGITTIDKDGIKVSMQDGEGSQGYTRIAHDGMEIFDSDGSRIAHFGDGNTAYIKSLTADKINNRHLLRWNEGRPKDLYVAPSATGDGTGRDANNKASSISNALNWLWNNYGCYSWQTDIVVHLAPGDYWGADNYIGGWIGTGVIYIILEPWACIRSTIRIEECAMTVVIKGSVDPYNIEVQDNAYLYLNYDSYGIYVRNSTVVVAGLNLQCEGWYGDTNTWGDYRGYGVYATDGSNVLITNCDIVGFWYASRSCVASHVSMLNCVGHVGCTGVAMDGGIISYDRALPMSKDGFWRNIGGFLWDSGGTWTSNSKFAPKPEAPQPVPPPPAETWAWVENTFWAGSLWTAPEGSGSGTSGRSGVWGQGKWGSYKPHRGYASFSGVNAWCDGGRNFTVELTMTRQNTSHGYAGAVPVPKIKTTNGSFWDCGQTFARGATHTITLPSDVANALANGSWTQLEMWAGTSTNDYSFYESVKIRVVCEKRVQ